MNFDTFITTAYVLVDDFVHATLPETETQGYVTSLSPSELVTLALIAHFPAFSSERMFYRYADRHLRAYFPRLPHHSQYNRLVRLHADLIAQLVVQSGQQLRRSDDAYEALDASAVPVRNVQRRGRGWLPGQAAKGRGSRVGWYFGFTTLFAVLPSGAITGLGFAPGNVKDQRLAETFFAVRRTPTAALQCVGPPADGPYLVDKGFEGIDNHRRWRDAYQARVICPPKTQNRIQWPRSLHRWASSLRQIVEHVIGRMQHVFGLDRERPHTVSGFHARLMARAALNNLLIVINRATGRADLSQELLGDY